MKKLWFILATLLFSIITTTMVFAAESIVAECKTINDQEGDGVIFSDGTLTIGGTSIDVDDSSSATLSFQPKNGNTMSKHFAIEDITRIKTAAQSKAREINGATSNGVKEVGDVITDMGNSVNDVASGMSTFTFDPVKGLSAIGGFKDIIIWFMNLILGLTWIFFIMSTVIDLGVISAQPLRNIVLAPKGKDK